MIDRLIRASLTNRPLVILLALATVGGGAYSAQRLAIDAFPDVTPVLVEVITLSEGLAPQEIEQLVTYPIEAAMNGLPDVERVQSLSIFGLSDVKVYFEDGVDIYFARQLVRSRLQEVRAQLPEDVEEPELAAITTALGQVYGYVLEGPAYDAMELRAIQDWVVRRSLRTVPGVADVVSFGGLVRQYQIRVDPRRLVQYDVTLGDVADAVGSNNRNVGGGYLEIGAEESLVRGLGRVSTAEEIGEIVVATRGGTPIHVREIGEVAIGAGVRRGAVLQDDKGEVVTGFVLKRIGENTAQVVARVDEKTAELNRTLPTGVRIVPFYDQSALVRRAVATVVDALLVGGVLVLGVLLLFLGDVRSAAVVSTTLILSLSLAFVLMQWFGMSANLMSLGGLAIGLGIMVDGGVVMVENVFRHLSAASPGERRLDVVWRAAQEVGRPVAFAISIIVAVFLPLFTLQGIEGKLFKPLAVTISLAMLGSLIFSLTVIPVLAYVFSRPAGGKVTRLMQGIEPPYRLMLAWATRRRSRIVFVAAAMLAGSVALVPFLGSEFVPALEEGSLLIRITYAPSASLTQVIETTDRMQRRILETFGHHEVEGAVTFIGRADVGGEPEPVNNVEMWLALAPESDWRHDSKSDLIEAMDDVVGAFPGVQLSFLQPIEMRVEELISGVRAQLAIKVFGDDLSALLAAASSIADVVGDVEGAEDVQVEQVLGQPQTEIEVDRAAIAVHGLNVDDALRVIRAGVGGETVGQVLDGPRRFDILLRLQEPFRAGVPGISDLLVRAPDGIDAPLAQLATLSTVVGPMQISHENGQRRVVVQANVRGRDLGRFVSDAQGEVARRVELPQGLRVEWSGQFENQRRAMRRLSLIVPLTVTLIFLLLYQSLGSLALAALIILNIPFALVGGVVALFLSGQYLSVPASVGFIALFGVAVENGLVLVSYYKQLRTDGGMSIDEAVEKGTTLRLRPVLMTAATTGLGLIPLLFATGAGSDVQRPLATVVVGGLITSTLLTLVVVPSIYPWFDRGIQPRAAD